MRRLHALLLLPLLLAPAEALAHVKLKSSEPEAGATVAASGFHMELHFSGRIDAARSRLAVSAADGKTIPLAAQQGGDAGTLAADAPALPLGPCTLRYEALSVDGHLNKGSLTFTVKE